MKNVKTGVLVGVFSLILVATGAQAMTAKDDGVMKKDDAMMSSTSDAMMKKDEVMMKTDDSMMKKDIGVMMPAAVDLFIGSRGEGVVSLQTFLVGKNLLIIPAGVPLGYFGPLTKAALMSYQMSVDVPSTGYYGPLTRAAMTAGMMMKSDDSMMKKDDAMMSSTSDAMMKKDDTMSSSSDAMMKKDDAMMKKGS